MAMGGSRIPLTLADHRGLPITWVIRRLAGKNTAVYTNNRMIPLYSIVAFFSAYVRPGERTLRKDVAKPERFH